MIIVGYIFMFVVVFGFITIERLLKKKLENDERIISRLDLLINEMEKKNRTEH
ncbi:MAG: hypothetical protein ACE3L7_10640 [Candidatus Pristimantibacillus sp.]